MNKKAVTRIGWIIQSMVRESKPFDPSINRIEKITRNDRFRSLVFTILSARTKDENTIIASRRLLNISPTPFALSKLPISRIESLIHSCGFYHAKAKHLKGMAKMLLRDFEGSVPNSLEKLLELPGVGRKTANIMLVYSFNKYAIPVDTHVHRISNRLGIIKTKSPKQTELALTKSIPKRFWKNLNHAFVAYGQSICLPRNPKCADCKIRPICNRIGVKR